LHTGRFDYVFAGSIETLGPGSCVFFTCFYHWFSSFHCSVNNIEWGNGCDLLFRRILLVDQLLKERLLSVYWQVSFSIFSKDLSPETKNDFHNDGMIAIGRVSD